MKIAVRKTDGYVLNGYMLYDGLVHDYEAEKHVFEVEEYEEFEIQELPCFPDKEWFSKHLYYKTGCVSASYIPQAYMIQQELIKLHRDINLSDYKVIKTYEASLLGIDPEYNMQEVYTMRQSIRDRINKLENYLKTE